MLVQFLDTKVLLILLVLSQCGFTIQNLVSFCLFIITPLFSFGGVTASVASGLVVNATQTVLLRQFVFVESLALFASILVCFCVGYTFVLLFRLRRTVEKETFVSSFLSSIRSSFWRQVLSLTFAVFVYRSYQWFSKKVEEDGEKSFEANNVKVSNALRKSSLYINWMRNSIEIFEDVMSINLSPFLDSICLLFDYFANLVGFSNRLPDEVINEGLMDDLQAIWFAKPTVPFVPQTSLSAAKASSAGCTYALRCEDCKLFYDVNQKVVLKEYRKHNDDSSRCVPPLVDKYCNRGCLGKHEIYCVCDPTKPKAGKCGRQFTLVPKKNFSPMDLLTAVREGISTHIYNLCGYLPAATVATCIVFVSGLLIVLISYHFRNSLKEFTRFGGRFTAYGANACQDFKDTEIVIPSPKVDLEGKGKTKRGRGRKHVKAPLPKQVLISTFAYFDEIYGIVNWDDSYHSRDDFLFNYVQSKFDNIDADDLMQLYGDGWEVTVEELEYDDEVANHRQDMIRKGDIEDPRLVIQMRDDNRRKLHTHRKDRGLMDMDVDWEAKFSRLETKVAETLASVLTSKSPVVTPKDIDMESLKSLLVKNGESVSKLAQKFDSITTKPKKSLEAAIPGKPTITRTTINRAFDATWSVRVDNIPKIGSAISIHKGFLFNNHFLYTTSGQKVSELKLYRGQNTIDVDLSKVVRYKESDLAFYPYNFIDSKQKLVFLSMDAVSVKGEYQVHTIFDGFNDGFSSTSAPITEDEPTKNTISADYSSAAGSCGSAIFRRGTSFVGIHSSTRNNGTNQFIGFSPEIIAWVKSSSQA
jgi:hypothetical protein